MMTALEGVSATVDPEVNSLGDVAMVGEKRWQEIHQLFREEGVPIAEIGRRLDEIVTPALASLEPLSDCRTGSTAPKPGDSP